VKQPAFKSALRYAATAAAVVFVVFIYHVVIRVNPTTVALTFLVGVLIASANWGLQPAVFMALVATLAFNYYFLPPVGTLTIADPQNWVALFAFLVTAIIASQLAERARREAQSANERRGEAERRRNRADAGAARSWKTSLLLQRPALLHADFRAD